MALIRTHKRFLLRLILILLSLLTILIVEYYIVYDDQQSYLPLAMKIVNGDQCYRHHVSMKNSNSTNTPQRYLDDILDNDMQPMTGKAIFFHETTCSIDGILNINAKQACAIESAARQNPDRDIFVLFASPVGIKNDTKLRFYNKLQNFTNIHWRNVDLWRYSRNTELFDWLQSNKLFDSSYLFEHMSDIVRALTLYRYGGYHLDLDVIVMKNLDDLGENFQGNDWSDVINGAVLHMNNFGIGKRVLQQFFEEVIESFDGGNFIANGPTILTRIWQQICKEKDRRLWTTDKCQGLTLHPKETFYPISWDNFLLYFDPNQLENALKLVKNASVIHLWNDRSRGIWTGVGTNNAYQVIAGEKCPSVYKASEQF